MILADKDRSRGAVTLAKSSHLSLQGLSTKPRCNSQFEDARQVPRSPFPFEPEYCVFPLIDEVRTTKLRDCVDVCLLLTPTRAVCGVDYNLSCLARFHGISCHVGAVAFEHRLRFGSRNFQNGSQFIFRKLRAFFAERISSHEGHGKEHKGPNWSLATG